MVLFGGEGGHGGERLLVRGRARAVPGMVLARIAWRYCAQSRPAHVVITPLSVVRCGVPVIGSISGEVSW
ncbi:hypothetical protein AB0A74_14465 [Saccharothrix sp. NPDC042600]|uniref:hypothetical protein n=1 Tax=Saccharothrix TaxID=2071 RepID=UPI00340CF0A1|nr:hypothetical protein GCM10017745_59290 [Saccharothrix mutabilis subsp. capreolus]